MEGVQAVGVMRYALLATALIALLAASFLYGKQSVQGMAIAEIEKIRQQEEPAVKTYTKAVCNTQGGIRHCEDKLVMVVGGKEYVAENSEVSGKADFLEN